MPGILLVRAPARRQAKQARNRDKGNYNEPLRVLRQCSETGEDSLVEISYNTSSIMSESSFGALLKELDDVLLAQKWSMLPLSKGFEKTFAFLIVPPKIIICKI